MRAKSTPGWSLSDADREAVSGLLAAVPPDADEGDPRLLAVLERWEQVGAPWSLRPGVCCYRVRGGAWLHGGPATLEAIRVHVTS